jgi:hypothetical protein
MLRSISLLSIDLSVATAVVAAVGQYSQSISLLSTDNQSCCCCRMILLLPLLMSCDTMILLLLLIDLSLAVVN